MERVTMDLTGRVAIVTGASRGIGAEIAAGLAAHGAKVVVSSRRQEAVDAVAAQINAAGGEALPLACHVGDPDSVRALIEQTVEAFGRLDIVVNNAATNPIFGPTLQAELEAFDKIMAVNLRGPLVLAQAAHPHLKAQGGSIINISSIGGVSPEPGLGLYSVSKAALISLTQVLAKEWGPDGVRANVICPGLIKTRFSEALWSNDAILHRMTAALPAGRIGTPEDLVGMAVFLASDASSYCTGGVYMVDGGHTI